MYGTYSKLFDACIRPILDYCSGIWGFKNYDQCNIVQNRAIRSFLGVHKYAANSAINSDMGWLPCQNRRKLNMIRFWYRLIKMPIDRLTKQIFEWDMSITLNETSNNWCNDMKLLFQDLNLYDIFERKTLPSLDNTLKSITSKFVQRTTDLWKEQCTV